MQKHGPISGTFYIDPHIPSVGFHTKGGKARKKNPPHASFRTRHGNMSMNLGTTGETRVAPRKANVLVSSHHGDINIKLMRVMKQSQKDALVMLGGQTMGETGDLNFCELETRHGKVVVGLSDVDKYDSAPGFWKRLFGH
ncbi:hypothetical protein C0995_014771 [Termitomyces sp. Mi166|nr:hypothetical protein C0995_014771 [Termitomyces sp. Mi166\